MLTLGFVGGTGPQGRGLALRFGAVGYKVLLGSRVPTRALEAVESIDSIIPGMDITGVTNQEAAQLSDMVLLTVPYDGQKPLLESVQSSLIGKVVVSVGSPLVFAKGIAGTLPVAEGSVAEQVQALLPGAAVVAAFQNISAEDLLNPTHAIEGDVIVCSDHKDAKKQVMELAQVAKNVRAVDGGGLQNSRYVEEFTALLLNINRIYKGRSSIKIVGIE